MKPKEFTDLQETRELLFFFTQSVFHKVSFYPLSVLKISQILSFTSFNWHNRDKKTCWKSWLLKLLGTKRMKRVHLMMKLLLYSEKTAWGSRIKNLPLAMDIWWNARQYYSCKIRKTRYYLKNTPINDKLVQCRIFRVHRNH